MKKSLLESKIIRFYILLWGMFVTGILIAIPFSNTQSQLRYVALAGFLLSMGSLVLIISMLSSIQIEIKERYSKAINSEKRFLTTLFYFVRGFFLLLGLLILVFSLLRKDVQENSLIKISGEISNIEIVGQANPSLKITIKNNSNQYGINTFEIPDEKLQQIEEELQPGTLVYFWIERDDKDVINNKYVQIYGIESKTRNYLSINEYNKSDSMNNFYGFILAIFFAGSGLVYLLTGRIKTRQDHKLQINHSFDG